MFNPFCVDLSEVQDSDSCLMFMSHAYVSFPCHVPVYHSKFGLGLQLAIHVALGKGTY